VIEFIKKRSFKEKSLKLFFFFLLIFTFCSCSKKSSGKPRLGYLLNVTHAVPIVAIEEGLFDEYEVTHFVSGGYLLNSLMSKNIDIAYIGPGPYLNAISKGVDLKLLGLSAVGANAFLVNEKFKTDKNFKIKKIAVPQFGNTQDLLVRGFIDRLTKARESQVKLPNDLMDIANELLDTKKIEFAKKVDYIAISPSELEMVLHKNAIDAVIIPEPWGTLLADKGYVNLSAELKQKSLISSLEDDHETKLRTEVNRMNTFPATLLVVRGEYYDTHSREVENLVVKNDYVLDVITMDTESAIQSIQEHYRRIAGKAFPENVIKSSLRNISFSSELDLDKLSELEEIAIGARYIKRKKALVAKFD
jgi:NitT/TauT family transport system substrate-binding protein